MSDRTKPRVVRFQIDFVAPDRSYVFARQLDGGDFSWPAGARLAGRLIRGVTAPRALNAAGRPRLDLFAFSLDADGLTVGDTAELVTPHS
jgi:hypothetical protein